MPFKLHLRHTDITQAGWSKTFAILIQFQNALVRFQRLIEPAREGLDFASHLGQQLIEEGARILQNPEVAGKAEWDFRLWINGIERWRIRIPHLDPALCALPDPPALAGFDGCYQGYVTELGREWLRGLDEAALREVEIFACGPTPMLKAAAALAQDFSLPCQVSLEEFMACAVGGCAGCVVQVNTASGPAMKRVCVDGPVFEAAAVDWGAIQH